MRLRNKKTGETFEWKEDIMPYGLGLPHPKSLAEINENWEDYKPTEPLIKDEKIRKAVRAWAEACGTERVYLSLENEEGSTFCIYTLQCNCVFMQIAVHDQNPIGGGRAYTITELCGEEEE